MEPGFTCLLAFIEDPLCAVTVMLLFTLGCPGNETDMTPVLMVPTLQQTGDQINKEDRFRASQDCEKNKTGWQVGSDWQLLRREL